MTIKVTKASGEVEDFSDDKLKHSLIRSGADTALAYEIAEKVLHDIEPFARTKDIYRLAKKYLRRMNHTSGLRYSLKHAIQWLGPSGYPFERYVGEILTQYGYEVNTGVLLKGRCVSHEVDVFAVREKEITVVECKYHNVSGKATDVKTAMYIHARMEDLKPVLAERFPGKEFLGKLITNTRCTTDALQYARCAGLAVIGWGHPRQGNLQTR